MYLILKESLLKLVSGNHNGKLQSGKVSSQPLTRFYLNYLWNVTKFPIVQSPCGSLPDGPQGVPTPCCSCGLLLCYIKAGLSDQQCTTGVTVFHLWGSVAASSLLCLRSLTLPEATWQVLRSTWQGTEASCQLPIKFKSWLCESIQTSLTKYQRSGNLETIETYCLQLRRLGVKGQSAHMTRWGPSPRSQTAFSLYPHMERGKGSSSVSLLWVVSNPSPKVPPSRPSHLPKVPPTNITTSGVQNFNMNWQGWGRHKQTMAPILQPRLQTIVAPTSILIATSWKL